MSAVDDTDWIQWLASEFKSVPTWVQLLKLTEECGEVAEAFIGAHAHNPRKGYTHSHDEVREELLDVAITALVAYSNYAYGGEQGRTEAHEPTRMLVEHVKSRLSRSLSARGISDSVLGDFGLPLATSGATSA